MSGGLDSPSGPRTRQGQGADRRSFTSRRWLIVGLALMLVGGHWGCASHKPLSERVRAQLGTIGVVSAEVPKVDLSAPSQGKCALAGAAAGAHAGAPFAPFVIVGLVIGGLAGTHVAASLPPADVTRDAETAIRRALDHLETDVGIPTMLREHVLQAGRERTRYSFPDLGEQILPTHRAASDGLKHSRPDANLEVRVERLSLPCGCGRCPLALKVPVRLVRTQDGRELSRSTIEYAGNDRSFTEWAASDAALLREELKLATERTAAAIVEELFLLYVVP